MKTLRYLAIAFLVLLPLSTQAADFRAEEEGQVWISDEVINDNLYIGSGSVSLDSTVNGDVFIGAGQVTVDGLIAEDLFVGAGDVRIVGNVIGDVRIGGGNVRIEGNVGGELMVGGGSVEITESATIRGNTYIGAGQLTIAGTTNSVMTQVDSLRVASSAEINGRLTYVSSREAQIDDGATIVGEVTHKSIPRQLENKDTIAKTVLFGGGVMWIILNIIMVVILVYAFPAKSAAIASDWKESFLKNLGTGFVVLVVVPIALVVLAISLLGIPLALVGAVLYALLTYTAALFTAIVIGAWIRKVLEKSTKLKVDWISAALGVVLLGIIKLIPVVGGIASFVMFLAALGAVSRYDWGLVTYLRKQKKF